MQPVSLETGIPIPETSKYPWQRLEVGESFLVPSDTIEDRRLTRGRLARLAVYHGRRRGTRYTIRSVPEGVRVWRVVTEAVTKGHSDD